MQHYAAFLRGVSPMNCKMPALAKAMEGAGFSHVRTLLSSGNVVFAGPRAPEAALRKKVEAATGFTAFIRTIDELAALLETDPFKPHRVPATAKRVVTFLHEAPQPPPSLPIEQQEARIVALHGRDVFSAYVPQPGNPVFMTLIAKTFGKEQTTRTWDTLAKVVKAGQAG